MNKTEIKKEKEKDIPKIKSFNLLGQYKDGDIDYFYVDDVQMNDFVINFFADEYWRHKHELVKATDRLKKLGDPNNIWVIKKKDDIFTFSGYDGYFNYIIYCHAPDYTIGNFEVLNYNNGKFALLNYNRANRFVAAMNSHYKSYDYIRFYTPIFKNK